MRTSHLVTLLGVAAGTFAGLVVIAGPVNPPGGSVVSTYKTLGEVEPRTVINLTNTPGDANSVYRIAASGSYYLDRNLAGATGKHCIEIEADNVTIDLMGFALIGASGQLDGINVPAARRNVVIRNGTIRSFPGSGIFASNVTGGEISDLLLTNNTLEGLWPGSQSVVRSVRSIANARHGFNLASNSGIQFRDCLVQGGFIGFEGGSASDNTYEGCTAQGCSNTGFRAFQETRFTHCESIGNSGHGFQFVTVRCEAIECSAQFNAGIGFTGGQGSAVINSLAANSNGSGIDLSGFSEVRGCRVIQNGGTGVNIGERSTVAQCQVTFGSGRGINATGFGCRIENNNVQQNQLEGIVVVGSTMVLNNSLDFNGTGAGTQADIRATGNNNRIDGNQCIGADIGIKCDLATGNFVVRNFCKGNGTNYDPASGVDMGSVQTTSLTSNPWANLQ